MVNTLSGSVSAYRNETIRKRLKVEPIEPSFITFSTIPTRSFDSVQYCLLSAWTGVVGKAVTTVARAKKPVHNRFHVFFINLMLLSF